MNDGLKQRLVGAVVLSCVALILWPVIFSDITNPVVDRTSKIPPIPDFDKYEVPEPVRIKNIEAADMTKPDRSNVAQEKPNSGSRPRATENSTNVPSLDKQGLPLSWVIQVASFSKKTNAEELKLALQKKGLKSYTRDIATKDGTSTRVFVGPKLTKQALKKDKAMIDKMFLLTSMIVPFKA